LLAILAGARKFPRAMNWSASSDVSSPSLRKIKCLWESSARTTIDGLTLEKDIVTGKILRRDEIRMREVETYIHFIFNTLIKLRIMCKIKYSKRTRKYFVEKLGTIFRENIREILHIRDFTHTHLYKVLTNLFSLSFAQSSNTVTILPPSVSL